MSNSVLAIDSPLVDVVDSVANNEHTSGMESGMEPRALKLLNHYEGSFALFRDGIFKLKQYYDMQMLLMKSHLHGDEDESIEVFFGKLIQIMELAVKQIFSLLDLSKMSGDIGTGIGELDRRDALTPDLPSSSSHTQHELQETNPAQPTFLRHHEDIPITSSSILSPQFEISYTNHDEETQNEDVMGKERDLCSNRYEPSDILLSGSNELVTNSLSSQQYLESGLDIGTSHSVSDDTCPFCKGTFATKRDLNRHIRTHTGEKPYHCEVCSKYFARNDFLIKHKRTHTGEKPHACTLCSKKFSQRSNLNKHMATHTKTHKHVCKVCGRGFHQTINLHRHEQLHCNSSKQFQCFWCSKMAYYGPNCFKTFLDKRQADNEAT